MAYLLSEEDFTGGDINVAGTEQTLVCEELCRFIARYEPRFMEAVLGYDLSKAFYDGAAEETVDQRWVDLADGVVWVRNGQNVNWTGIKFAAARYVYYYYMRHLVTLTTTAGEKIPQADNATPAEVNLKVIAAWADMFRQVCALRDYLQYAKTGDDLIYPEWNNGYQLSPRKFRPINQWGI
jgi:hypothetical protein